MPGTTGALLSQTGKMLATDSGLKTHTTDVVTRRCAKQSERRTGATNLTMMLQLRRLTAPQLPEI